MSNLISTIIKTTDLKGKGVSFFIGDSKPKNLGVNSYLFGLCEFQNLRATTTVGLAKERLQAKLEGLYDLETPASIELYKQVKHLYDEISCFKNSDVICSDLSKSFRSNEDVVNQVYTVMEILYENVVSGGVTNIQRKNDYVIIEERKRNISKMFTDCGVEVVDIKRQVDSKTSQVVFSILFKLEEHIVRFKNSFHDNYPKTKFTKEKYWEDEEEECCGKVCVAE